jgi:hypothetical protein
MRVEDIAAHSMWTSARARAHERGLPFTLRWQDIVVPSHCPVLGIPLDSRNRDHAPSLDEHTQGAGYTPENARVISLRANRIKSDATADELRRVADYASNRGATA